MSIYKGETPIAGIPTGLINTVNNKVSKAGDTMSGDLRINSTGANNSALKVSFPVTFGTAPSSNVYPNIEIEDINGNRMGRVEYTYKTDGSHMIGIIDKKSPTETTYNSITVGWDANGKKTYSPVQLITTYVSGTSGYRIWSDGYCEQWGYINIPSTDINVTLTKTYRDTNYNVQATNRECDSIINVRSISVNQFNVDRPSSNTGYMFWKTSGYLAEGQY